MKSKPCPFCSGTDLVIGHDTETKDVFIRCRQCDAIGPLVSVSDAVDEAALRRRKFVAIIKWNERAE